jgi:hypothetical protein
MSVSQNYHVPVYFKGAVPFSLERPLLGLTRVKASTLNAGVMRRFERVVALPDPNNFGFRWPNQCLCAGAV